jgi:hypothetical protein
LKDIAADSAFLLLAWLGLLVSIPLSVYYDWRYSRDRCSQCEPDD